MFFWNKNNKDDEQRRQREAATLQALADGKVPPAARERIEKQKEIGSNFFTSDLSSREYLLCRQAGFQTLGQVMGTSFFNVSFWGFYKSRWNATGELTNITHAQLEARRLAISRMQHEAQLMGASGIIGVKLVIKSHDWSSRQTEFTAVGTAVKIPGYPENLPPFTSDLNGQDFWKLYQAGYLPLAIAFGVCSYYIYTDSRTQSIVSKQFFGMNLASNQEVNSYTQGFYTARNLAMSRAKAHITDNGGDGLVGVLADYHIEDIEYEVNDRTYHDLLVHWSVMGTVISSKEEQLDKIPTPTMILDLASLSRSSVVMDTIYGGSGSDFDIDDDDDE
ncbi:MAG: heavy metal-binding domain-containing protein [Candidatus Melainabacteria bacterium]|nr:heavy metal-binding domain-containing protein [Candidatus Melainabacteria bacterium]